MSTARKLRRWRRWERYCDYLIRIDPHPVISRRMERAYNEKRKWRDRHDIDKQIAAWHDRPEDGQPLHEYLGLTWQQYRALMERGALPGPGNVPGP